MLEWVMMLQGLDSFTASSGVIGELLNSWEQGGFFSYILPFLLIFALTFGILVIVKIFKENNWVNGIIAIVVGLMALQFSFVPTFFAEIFPRLGVGLSIILGVLIIVGLFMDPDSKAVNFFLLGIGVLIIGMILIQSAGALGWQSGDWWQTNWKGVIGAIFLVIIVFVVVGASNPKESSHYKPNWARNE
ncbi:Uncharacterised protein [uncultured archaeon]|nr:Uncharacterised protein [uncultured archaeon]